MTRAIIVVCIFLFTVHDSFSQGKYRYDYIVKKFTDPSQPDTDLFKYEKKIRKEIRKDPVLSTTTGLRIYYIPELLYVGELPSIKKYLDGSFLEDLTYRFRVKLAFAPQSKYQISKYFYRYMGFALITDSVGNFIALYNGLQLQHESFFCSSEYLQKEANRYKQISKMLFNGDMDLAFYNFNISNVYFCLSKGEIFVLKYEEDKIERVPWEKYVLDNLGAAIL